MNEQVQKVIKDLQAKTPEMVKNNKGALIGAVVGYLLTDNKQAQSSILGAVAGALLVDKKEDKNV